jgi:hypothetical protein
MSQYSDIMSSLGMGSPPTMNNNRYDFNNGLVGYTEFEKLFLYDRTSPYLDSHSFQLKDEYGNIYNYINHGKGNIQEISNLVSPNYSAFKQGTGAGGGGESVFSSVTSKTGGRSVRSYSIKDGESIVLGPNGTLVANGNSPGIQQIAQIINDEIDDLSTQYESENVENVEYTGELISQNLPPLDKLNAIIDSIVVTDELGQTSDILSTYSDASSLFAVESGLEDLKNPQKVFEILKQKQKTNFTITGEVNDFTISLIQWMSTDPNSILENNNIYGLIKFCCANEIEVPGFPSNEIDFFYYELVCMKLSSNINMLKSTARNYREELLNYSRTNPVAIELFSRIYYILSYPGVGFKVCGVGGNVIKEYCLALRYALNFVGGKIAKEFDKIFKNAAEIAATKAFVQAQISTNPEFETWLNFLCDKCSDIDLSSFENPDQTDPTVEMCCKTVGIALSRALQAIFSSKTILCKGSVIFLLERIKFKYLCNQHSEFLKECYVRFDGNPIYNYEHTLEQAQKYFPKESWFPQMVSDNDFITNYTRGTLSHKEYHEIAKLHCVLQKLKGMNSEFTRCISEIIAQVDIENSKPDSHTFGAVRSYTESVCKNAVDSLNQLGLTQGCFGNVNIIKQCSAPIHAAFVKNMSVGLPGKTMKSILSIMPRKIPAGITVATYKNGGAWVPWSSHYCVDPTLECETMTSFFKSQKHEKTPLSYNISSTSNLIEFLSTLDVNPCGPQDEESDVISVKSASAVPGNLGASGGGGGNIQLFNSAAPSRQISLSIQKASSKSGGDYIYSTESLNSMTILELQNIQRIINATGSRGGVSKTKDAIITAILKKQGNLLGGSKTRKQKRRKRGMRNTRR